MKAKLTGLKPDDVVDSFRSDDIIRFEKSVSESSHNLTTNDLTPERNRKPFHKHMQTVPYNGQHIVEKSLRAMNTHASIAPTTSRNKELQFVDPEYANNFQDSDQKKVDTGILNKSSGSHSAQVRKLVVKLLTESVRKTRLANRFLRQVTEALTLVILVTLTVALFTLTSDT